MVLRGSGLLVLVRRVYRRVVSREVLAGTEIPGEGRLHLLQPQGFSSELGSGVHHFTALLITGGNSQDGIPTPQVVEEKARKVEAHRTEVLFAYQPNVLPPGQSGSPSHM